MRFVLNAFGVVGVVVLVVAMLCLCPFLAIWAINTLAEQAGTDFHIAHGLWSYLAVFLLILMLHSSTKSK